MGSTAQGNAKSFDPLRPAPESGDQKVDHGGVSAPAGPNVGAPDKPPTG